MENIFKLPVSPETALGGDLKGLAALWTGHRDAINRCDMDSVLWNGGNVSRESSVGPQQRAGTRANGADASSLISCHIGAFSAFGYYQVEEGKGRTLLALCSISEFDCEIAKHDRVPLEVAIVLVAELLKVTELEMPAARIPAQAGTAQSLLWASIYALAFSAVLSPHFPHKMEWGPMI